LKTPDLQDPFGSIDTLSKSFQQGVLTPSNVMEFHLQRIETHEPKLGAYQALYVESALSAADAASKAIASGHRIGPFHGIPFALKDICDLEGQITTNGSLALADRVSTMTGTIVRRLVAAGGIIIGKSKSVECAFGGWGTNQRMGTPWNPWDLAHQRVPGGSSSGSAVALAAGMAVCAVGTDTGGSVRLPAAYCGMVGLKVSEGRLPCDGIMPLAQTLDTPGPITQSVTDAGLMFQVMDGCEGWAIDQARASGTGMFAMLGKGVAGLRLGKIAEKERLNCSSEMLDSYDLAIEKLERLGAIIQVFNTPSPYGELANENGAIIAIEAYHNHGTLYEDTANPMDEDVRKRMLSGKNYLAHDYFRMLETRRNCGEAFTKNMGGLDAILTPTITSPAPMLTEINQDISPGHFTRPFNYLAMCALALPVGLSQGGIPTSLQVVGRSNDEMMVLRVGAALEAELPLIGRPNIG
jgi:aspartyl-tRNA(Asn)/glutamyl-tRNA(Gln) amidotransferase subunit A